MVLIRLASADYLWAGFPNECPSDKRFGCSRIAESNPHGARHLTPLHLAAAMPDVQAQAEAWIAASAQARRLLLLLPRLLLLLLLLLPRLLMLLLLLLLLPPQRRRGC